MEEALNHTQRSQVHLWNHSSNPPTLATEPDEVGKVFSECLATLGGDPNFSVDGSLLNGLITHFPKCPPHVKAKHLPEPDLEWFQHITSHAGLTKATGQDYINCYILSLCRESLHHAFLQAIRMVLRHGPPRPPVVKSHCVSFAQKGRPKRGHKLPSNV